MSATFNSFCTTITRSSLVQFTALTQEFLHNSTWVFPCAIYTADFRASPQQCLGVSPDTLHTTDSRVSQQYLGLPWCNSCYWLRCFYSNTWVFPHVIHITGSRFLHNNTWVFPDATFNDVCDVLEGWSVLFHHVVAQCNVVGEVSLVTHNLHGCCELEACLFVSAFLGIMKTAILMINVTVIKITMKKLTSLSCISTLI